MLRINGFVPVDDSHYDTVREIHRELTLALGPEALEEAPSPTSIEDQELVETQEDP